MHTNIMEKTTPKNAIEVIEGFTQLKAPHKSGKTIFISPYFGPDNYGNVAEKIDQAHLERPNFGESASLAYAAWQAPEEKYSAEVIRVLKDHLLLGFTGSLPTKEGIYIEDNPEIKDGKAVMNLSSLEKRLREGDPRVRFVPISKLKSGKMDASELAKSFYLIGLAGKEGAEKSAEIAGKYPYKPFLYIPSSENYAALSGLDVYVVGYGDWLRVYGGIGFRGADWCAFGVLDRTGEASSKKFSEVY